MTDYEVIKTVLQGETNNFSVIMNTYHNELFHYVFNITNNYQTTEDIIQEIFMKLYRSLKKYDPNKASFRTWMYRIAHNYVMNYITKKDYVLHQTYHNDDIDVASDEDIEQTLIKEQQINQVLRAMEKVLSPKHHKIMLLHYFSELSVKEISETLDIPDKTIYKAIKTSIEKIQKEVA